MKYFATYYRERKADAKSYIDTQKAMIAEYSVATGNQERICFLDFPDNKFSGLANAIAYCQANDCQLIMPRVKSLKNNTNFLSRLNESSISFVALDERHLNNLTIRPYFYLAEYGKQTISERNKEVFRAAKARGVTLGNPNLLNVRSSNTEAARKARLKRASDKRKVIKLAIKKIEEKYGAMSRKRMADHLNELGIKNLKGNDILATTVHNALAA